MEAVFLGKAMGALLLIVCGIGGGAIASERIRRRSEFLRQYALFLQQAESLIGYSRTEVGKILPSVHSVPLLQELLRDCSRGLEGGESISKAWAQGVEKAAARGDCDRADIPLLLRFGEHFGEWGAEEEMGRLSLCREDARRRWEEEWPEVKKRASLCRMIGTFAGILAAVVLL